MNRIITIFAATLTLFLSSCQSEEPGADAQQQEATVSFSISTRAANASSTQGTTLDNELIHDWWVAFIDSHNNVGAVVTRPAGYTATGVEEEQFQAKIEAGTYTVYAFANMSALPDDTRNTISSIAANGHIPLGFASSSTTLAPYYTEGTQLIPMSGIMTGVEIYDGAHIEIEVVRMLAKIEFEFTNQSNSDMTVTGVTLGPLYGNPLNIFPSPTGNTVSNPTISSDWTYTTGNVDFNLNLAKDGQATTGHFYVRETASTFHPSGQFYLSVSLRRDGGETEEKRYALAGGIDGEILKAICRNDYIQIPILLQDWIVELEAHFYPPIGGYPAMVTKEEQGEFYITFGSSGLFELTPLVRRSLQDPYLPAHKYDVEILSVDDPANILDGTGINKISNENGEFIGRINDTTAKGKATVSVRFTIKSSDSANQTFIRNFYIIKD